LKVIKSNHHHGDCTSTSPAAMLNLLPPRCFEADSENGVMIVIQQAQYPSSRTARRQGHRVTVAPSLNQLCCRCQEHIHPAMLAE